MATNGFGSIYPNSYWGVTDAANGFGNVYKDLAAQIILLNFELVDDGRTNINVYLTNKIVSNIVSDVLVVYSIEYLDANDERVALDRNQNIILTRQNLIENNNNLLLETFKKTPYDSNIVKCIVSIEELIQDEEAIPNPFEVDGTNYLVKLTPSV